MTLPRLVTLNNVIDASPLRREPAEIADEVCDELVERRLFDWLFDRRFRGGLQFNRQVERLVVEIRRLLESKT